MKKNILLIALLLFTKPIFAQKFTASDFISDLKYLRDTLASKHKNLFAKISPTSFEQKIMDIEAKANTLNYESFNIELLKLIVSIGDEHTRIESRYEKLLPIKFNLFKEGIFALRTDSSHADQLQMQLAGVNGKTINSVLEEFKTIVQNENRSFFDVNFLYLINKPSILKGLGISSSNEEVEFTFKDAQGKMLKTVQKSILNTENIKPVLAEGYKKLLSSKKEGNYWFDYDANKNVLYFKYARCQNEKNYSFIKFNEDLFKEIELKKPSKIIIDLRNNSGGNSAILLPFIDQLKTSYLNTSNKLFVLIGKETFSSALMNAVDLKRNTNALLIGEPTSGNINHYGEVKSFTLPITKINIGYSTKYWEMWKGKKGPLLPDYKIDYSIENFKNGIDEALEHVYKQ